MDFEKVHSIRIRYRAPDFGERSGSGRLLSSGSGLTGITLLEPGTDLVSPKKTCRENQQGGNKAGFGFDGFHDQEGLRFTWMKIETWIATSRGAGLGFEDLLIPAPNAKASSIPTWIDDDAIK
jgi:hypothetical protein